MTPARGSWMGPTPRPGELLREGLGRGEDRKTGRAGGDQPSCAILLCSRSQPETLAALPREMQLHSFQLSPAASAARQARELGSSAREGFPALLSPAFPSGAGVSSKSQQAQESQQESWLSRLWKVSDPSPRHVPSHGTTLMSQHSGRAQRSQPSAITKCSCPGFN